jgi:hypothetical protein
MYISYLYALGRIILFFGVSRNLKFSVYDMRMLSEFTVVTAACKTGMYPRGPENMRARRVARLVRTDIFPPKILHHLL